MSNHIKVNATEPRSARTIIWHTASLQPVWELESHISLYSNMQSKDYGYSLTEKNCSFFNQFRNNFQKDKGYKQWMIKQKQCHLHQNKLNNGLENKFN